MLDRKVVIESFVRLGEDFSNNSEQLQALIQRACFENPWFTNENYSRSINAWVDLLQLAKLSSFASPYRYAEAPKHIGIIMAGNIPLVGFHDLLCVLLSGNKAKVKVSSKDSPVMKYIVTQLGEKLSNSIELVEQVKGVDAVIATGSNNSYRYFEYYFKNIPHVLRKNRKSVAVLSGNESEDELKALGDDVFAYFGLGCRNVSQIFLPESMKIDSVLDQWESYQDLLNHNKYANNYTYHKALLLMNSEEHLDTNYVLLKNKRELNAPLGCLHYSYYKNEEELRGFIQKNNENIQCIVGNYFDSQFIQFGNAQSPELQDFADNVDTMHFLNQLD